MPTGTDIKLSIAIVTYNRSSSLQKTLESLADQDVKPYEILISDDSDNEKDISETRKLAEMFNCRYLTGPRRGLYANRNFVARACSGTHIRTMDDDHLFPAGHLKACLDAIEREPNTIWAIGEILLKDYVRGLRDVRIPGQLQPRGYAYLIEGKKNYGISCGGTIYPAKIIQDSVLNMEFYLFGALYLEYGARLVYLGYTIKGLTTTYLIHNDRASTASLLSNFVIVEARIYAMLCLSFLYKRNFKNMFLTSYQIAWEMIQGKVSTAMFKGALGHFKTTRQLVDSRG